MGNASKSIVINFGDNGSVNTDPKDITITIKDVCTKAIITGAEVTLTLDSGDQTQISNANGQVTFLQVPAGTHQIKITAAGYLDNDTDTLANDSITI